MPLYEYRCRDCGHQFEIQQSLADDPLSECPTCAGDLRKVFSPVGIAFKGSGFYKTDSRSGGSSTSGDSPGGSGTSGDSSGTSGSSEGSSGGDGSGGGSSSGGGDTPATPAASTA